MKFNFRHCGSFDKPILQIYCLKIIVLDDVVLTHVICNINIKPETDNDCMNWILLLILTGIQDYLHESVQHWLILTMNAEVREETSVTAISYWRDENIFTLATLNTRLYIVIHYLCRNLKWMTINKALSCILSDWNTKIIINNWNDCSYKDVSWDQLIQSKTSSWRIVRWCYSYQMNLTELVSSWPSSTITFSCVRWITWSRLDAAEEPICKQSLANDLVV